MRSLTVHLAQRSYPIHLGTRIMPQFGARIRRLSLGDLAVIITNPTVERRYGPVLLRQVRKAGIACCLYRVADSETSKSIADACALLEELARLDRGKRIFLIALGGGVVGDLTGFCAATYRRGIPYVQVPTTLLAQLDSAIGGKTGVDLARGKNLVGVFYQPRMVFTELKFLQSLPLRQIQSGLAEAIKYAAIMDRQLFVYLEENIRRARAKDPAVLEHIVTRCSSLKAKLVEKDERDETGCRRILNFGHTIGHAIETAGRYRSHTHGEAVGLGMIAASGLSVAKGLFTGKDAARLRALIEAAGLPCVLRGVTERAVIEAHYRDKKFLGRRNRLVLLNGLSHAVTAEDIGLALIRRQVRALLGRKKSA